MIPTEHYDRLREALNAYRLDSRYSTVEDCVAHVLLDVKVWAESIGMDEGFHVAMQRCYEIVMEQRKWAIKELEEIEARFGSCCSGGERHDKDN